MSRSFAGQKTQNAPTQQNNTQTPLQTPFSVLQPLHPPKMSDAPTFVHRRAASAYVCVRHVANGASVIRARHSRSTVFRSSPATEHMACLGPRCGRQSGAVTADGAPRSSKRLGCEPRTLGSARHQVGGLLHGLRTKLHQLQTSSAPVGGRRGWGGRVVGEGEEVL